MNKEEFIKKFDKLSYYKQFKYSIEFNYLDGIKRIHNYEKEITKYIIIALNLKRYDICDYLIDENASTFLLYVARSCDLETFKYLLSKNADIFHSNIIKQIAYNKNIELLKYICENYILTKTHSDIITNVIIETNDVKKLKYIISKNNINIDSYKIINIVKNKRDRLFKIIAEYYKIYEIIPTLLLTISFDYEYIYGINFLRNMKKVVYEELLMDSIKNNKYTIIDYILSKHKNIKYDSIAKYVIEFNRIDVINYFIKYNINAKVDNLIMNDTKKMYIEYMRINKMNKLCVNI